MTDENYTNSHMSDEINQVILVFHLSHLISVQSVWTEWGDDIVNVGSSL